MHQPEQRELQQSQEVCVCVFFHSERGNQGDDKKKARIESISTTITRIMQRGDPTREVRGDPTQKVLQGKTEQIKVKVQKNQRNEADAQVVDENPARGIMCSSSQNDGNPNACSFSEKEEL